MARRQLSDQKKNTGRQSNSLTTYSVKRIVWASLQNDYLWKKISTKRKTTTKWSWFYILLESINSF